MGSLASVKEINEENARLNRQILDLEKSVEDKIANIDGIIADAEGSLKTIKTWSRVAFGLGIFLILLSIGTYFLHLGLTIQGFTIPDGLTLGALGLGAVGVVDLIGFLVYKPMDRIQKATQDFAQLTMVSHQWNLTTKIIMRAMKFTGEQVSFKEGIELLNGLLDKIVKMLEQFV